MSVETKKLSLKEMVEKMKALNSDIEKTNQEIKVLRIDSETHKICSLINKMVLDKMNLDIHFSIEDVYPFIEKCKEEVNSKINPIYKPHVIYKVNKYFLKYANL